MKPTNTTSNRFAHRRLDAYRVALELYYGVERLAAGFPAGFADLKDQLRRAAAARMTPRSSGVGPSGVGARNSTLRAAVT